VLIGLTFLPNGEIVTLVRPSVMVGCIWESGGHKKDE